MFLSKNIPQLNIFPFTSSNLKLWYPLSAWASFGGGRGGGGGDITRCLIPDECCDTKLKPAV